MIIRQEVKMRDNYKLKMALISGAWHALDFKAKNPGATNEEIVREITESSDEILEKIDE